MKIVAQSQPPAKVGYIHLAYISAALGKGISKGELLPQQVVFGIALAAAMACAALGLKVGRKGRPVRAAMVGAFLGLAAILALYKTAETIWTSTLSNEQVAEHVIESHQFWALRDKTIAATVEFVALTNGTAASMAAQYYTLQRHRETNIATTCLVKAYYYSQLAEAKGDKFSWLRVDDLNDNTRAEDLQIKFQDAIEKRMLSPTEQQWATQQVARFKVLAESPW